MEKSKKNDQGRTCCGPSCCTGDGRGSVGSAAAAGVTAVPSADEVRARVREGYAAIAEKGAWLEDSARSSCCTPASASAVKSGGGGGGCCGGSPLSVDELVKNIGYTDGELAALPEGANLGLSCGNPTAIASLKAGEVVLDLGSGGGFDCFVAGPKVGAAGRVIGVDMTAEMVTRARRNSEGYTKASGLSNVEFRLGEIEHLPVADASVDVVISNCVLNLSPDKPQVWREIGRVLKPGGRVAVSDLALLRPLPEEVKDLVGALVGCVAGAALVSEVETAARAAGIVDLKLTPKPGYVEAMTSSEDPLYQKIIAASPPGTKPTDYITSLDISGVRA